MKRFLSAAAVAAGVLASVNAASAAECGRVTVADMNWASATLIANLDVLVLKHGYGCDAEVIPGDTMPTGTSMVEKGEPDIAPEFWSNNFAAALAKGVEEKTLRMSKVFADGGEEGFWVPKYLVDKDPSLATIEGIKANAAMFEHPEDPSRSAFVGCPAGWGCQISAGNLHAALGLGDAGFDLIDPGSAAGLDGSIARAYERGNAWFGYYWAPTSILGKYEMVKVDFGSGTDVDHFQNCIAKADCTDPKPSMYPPSPVDTVVTEGFASRVPAAYEYIAKRSFTNPDMNKLLVWIEDNQADGETAAIHFLKNHSDKWMNWVSADAAANIKSALDSL